MQRNMFQQKKEDKRMRKAEIQENKAAMSFTTSDPNTLISQFGKNSFPSMFGNNAQPMIIGNGAQRTSTIQHGDTFIREITSSSNDSQSQFTNSLQTPLQSSGMWRGNGPTDRVVVQQGGQTTRHIINNQSFQKLSSSSTGMSFGNGQMFPKDNVVVHQGGQAARYITSNQPFQQSSSSIGDLNLEASITATKTSTVRVIKRKRVFINGKEVEISEEVEQDDRNETMKGTTQGKGNDMQRLMMTGNNGFPNFLQSPNFNSNFESRLKAGPNVSFEKDQNQLVQKQSLSPFQGFCNSAYGFGANVNELVQTDGGRHGWFSGMQLALPTQSGLGPFSRNSTGGTKSHFTYHAVNRKTKMTNVNGEYSVQAAQQEQMFEYYSEDEDDGDESEDRAIDYSRILPDEHLRRSIMPLALDYSPLPLTGSSRLALPPPPGSTPDKSLHISQLSLQSKTPTSDVLSTRYYFVAKEIADKEKSYRDVLYLLDQIFRKRVVEENKEHNMFPEKTIKDMFGNVETLFKFHDAHLLPRLQERLNSWETKPKIGDVLNNAAPYLKIYETYINNYRNAMKTLQLQEKKSEVFARIVQQLRSLDECLNIPLFDHMIAPVQRMPRYELLLKEYLKHLPPDSEDRSDAEKALKAITEMSEQANESLRAVEQFKAVLEAQEAMGGVLDLVSPSRLLLKHGDIKKISMKSLLQFDRHLYLFSDILIVCAPRMFGKHYKWKVRAIFSLHQMYVMEGDDLEVPNTFFIMDSGRKFQFHTKTTEEKRSWMEAIFIGIRDSITTKFSETSETKRPPLIFSAENVPKCMECNTTFSVIKKRTHCRSCGSVICYSCGESKQVLQWTAGKLVRVCKHCKEQLASAKTPVPPSPDSKLLGILAVPARKPGIIDGWVCLYNEELHNIVQRWFVLRDDQVLYTYEKETDKVAVTAAPIRGFVVEEVTETVKKKGIRKLIRLKGSNKMYLLMPKSLDDHSRWLRCLQEVSQATPS